MAGFSLSTDELKRVCHRMRVHSDRARDEAELVGAGEAGAMDFGGPAHEEIARRYGEVLADAVPRMVREFQLGARSVADRLEWTLAAYVAMDEDAARRMR